jgi:hypothetical protein
MKNKIEKVNSSMVEVWVGSGFTNGRNQNTSREDCYKMLADIANGKYKPEELKNDILGHEQ